jgi:hypothetical protein
MDEAGESGTATTTATLPGSALPMKERRTT